MEEDIDNDPSRARCGSVVPSGSSNSREDDPKDQNVRKLNFMDSVSSVQSGTLKRAAPSSHVDLSRSDLIRLLSYLEGELQARDIVIATLKAEKAKQMLYQAKYGRLGLNDPLAALQRDSETAASSNDFDEAQIGKLYESQLAHLERLIAVQRRAHQRAKQVLSAAERRHARSVRELEQERKRRAQDAAQGDDVCMMLEKERERLKQELQNQKGEQDKVEREMEKVKRSLIDEKERHKQIVLYLLQERRQLLIRVMEERQKVLRLEQQQKSPTASQEPNVAKKPLNNNDTGTLTETDSRRELETTRKLLDDERKETSTLKEIVKTQEEDLNLIRQMILAKTRQVAASSPSAPASPQAAKTVNVSAGKAPATASASASAAGGKFQILPRPITSTHYASAEIGSSAQSSSQQTQAAPIRVLTNPAYQQPQQPPQSVHYQSAAVAGNGPAMPNASGRVRPLPPYAQAAALSSRNATPPMASEDMNAAGSNYASPRVIPIQYATSADPPTTLPIQPLPQYAALTSGSARRPPPGPASSSAPQTQQGMVSAAKNYMSTVVAAVSNAAHNGPLMGSKRQQSPQAGQPAPPVSSPLREQWSYAAQVTSSSPAASSTSSINAHKMGVAASVYSMTGGQQQQPASKKSSSTAARTATSTSGTSSAGSQQVSDEDEEEEEEDGNEKYSGPAAGVVEPEIAQLEAVINSMGVLAAGNAAVTSQFPNCVDNAQNAAAAQQLISGNGSPGISAQQSFVPFSLYSTINRLGISNVRGRPLSPVIQNQVGNAYQRGSAAQGPQTVATAGVAAPTKRTPTPVPVNRVPLPTAADSSQPVPAMTKTSAIGPTLTLSTTSAGAARGPSPTVAVTVTVTDSQQDRQQQATVNAAASASTSSQGTLGRKVKAVSGLANKLQRRVVNQVSAVKQRGMKDHIRSTQV